jgi:cyclohexa-1,5-dienecarbonyl-CoA hydratase
MSAPKAKLAFEHGAQVARVALAAPKANILDRAMMAELEKILDQLEPRRDLKAIVLGAEGPHFSYGASVEEHLPDQIATTLAQFHRLLRRLAALPAPTIAAVRGQCLGGGFELVLACDLILAEETAQLGSPEIKLAVFPPAATALLPVRIGTGPTAALVLTGTSWSGVAAAATGLVARTAPAGELESVLDDWLKKDFLPRSPAALRHVVHSVRRPLLRALAEDLPELERRYLEELMAEPDALEGIRAFLEKRPPRWGGSKGEAA